MQIPDAALSDGFFVVLVAIGINDSKVVLPDAVPLVEESEFKKNLLRIVSIAEECRAPMAFIGLTPVDEDRTGNYEGTKFTNERIGRYDSIIKRLCAETGVPFLDMFELMKEEGFLPMLDDGLHPNERGYRFMYGKVLRFLSEEKLLPS